METNQFDGIQCCAPTKCAIILDASQYLAKHTAITGHTHSVLCQSTALNYSYTVSRTDPENGGWHGEGAWASY